LLAKRDMRFDVDFPFDCSWMRGANMSYRKGVIERVGGFDENFFAVASGEDAEFCHRLKKHNALMRYSPAASLIHLAEATGGCRDIARPEKRIPAEVRNAVYFWRKVGQSRWQRFAALARLFRRTVCTKKTLREGRVLPSSLFFLRGLASGHRFANERLSNGCRP
jgi:GT2 family glycosyltransferase